MLALVILAVPLTAGLVAALTPWRQWVGWLTTASLGVVLIWGVTNSARVVTASVLGLRS